MRLAVVGHTYVVAQNQEKYAAMKRLDPTLELRLIVPRRARHDVFRHTYALERHAQLDAQEIVPLATALGCSHVTAVYDPPGLARVFARFRPEVIHVEEEPQSVVTLEVVLARAALAPNAALTVFTWDNLLRRRRFPLGAVKGVLRRFTLRRADLLLCGNRDAETLARDEASAARIQFRTHVVPQLGLDPAAHRPGREPKLRRELGLSEGVVVAYVGRMIPEKGVGLLHEALASLACRRWKLLLVGSGPLEREIREQWMARLPGRIVHVPAVAHDQVPRYLRCADIFALDSYAVPAWKEQFGLTLAQAMMLGIPSIVSNSGALPEVAGDAAMIVPERDTRELRAALDALVASPDLRGEIGDRGRIRALRFYTNDAVAARTYQAFEQALARRTGSPARSQFSRQECGHGIDG
ncbi:MAG: glycosyltransferase family 4 protein [Candidatus Acidiferrales bacterium]